MTEQERHAKIVDETHQKAFLLSANDRIGAFLEKTMDVVRSLIENDAEPNKMEERIHDLAELQKFDDGRDTIRDLVVRCWDYELTESLMQTVMHITKREQKRIERAVKNDGASQTSYDLCDVSDQDENIDEAEANMNNGQTQTRQGNPKLLRYARTFNATSTIDAANDQTISKNASGNLLCNVCGKIFNWKTGNARRDLDDHMRTHLDPNDVRRKPYECKMCGKRFGLHNNLAKHKRTHLEKDDPRRKRDKPVKCDVCQKILSGRDALKMHKLIHLDESEWTHQCDECDKRFSKKIYLKTHKSKEHLPMDHPNQVKVKCQVCKKILNNTYYLERHMMIHSDDYAQQVAEIKKQITCNLCGKGFRTSTLLKMHSQCHTRDFAYKCEPCNKGFAERRAFNMHMTSHERGTVRPLKRNRLCPVCPRKFRTEPQLIEHLKRHEDGMVDSSDEASYECSICGKKCTSSVSLREHSLQHLEGEENQRPFKCDKCEKRFVRKEALKNHKRCRHPDAEHPPREKKRIECEICGEFFSKIAAHRKTHLDDRDPAKRPHKCDECGKSFRMKMNLERHKSGVHQKSYPLSCELCSKGFFDKRRLTKHMQRHDKQTSRKGASKKSACSRGTRAERTNVGGMDDESSSSESEDELSDQDDSGSSDDEDRATMN